MIEPTAWEWPQYTLMALMFLGLVVTAAEHGKPNPHNYSFPMKFCQVGLWLFLLTFGGFFA